MSKFFFKKIYTLILNILRKSRPIANATDSDFKTLKAIDFV